MLQSVISFQTKVKYLHWQLWKCCWFQLISDNEVVVTLYLFVCKVWVHPPGGLTLFRVCDVMINQILMIQPFEFRPVWNRKVQPGPRDCYVLDLFSGLSSRMAAAWRRRGFRAVSFDILSGGEDEDLATRCGFETLLLKALRLVPLAMVVGGPPCSMFVWLSSSQHLRHLFGAWGSPRDVKTQLANVLAKNTVLWLHA